MSNFISVPEAKQPPYPKPASFEETRKPAKTRVSRQVMLRDDPIPFSLFFPFFFLSFHNRRNSSALGNFRSQNLLVQKCSDLSGVEKKKVSIFFFHSFIDDLPLLAPLLLLLLLLLYENSMSVINLGFVRRLLFCALTECLRCEQESSKLLQSDSLHDTWVQCKRFIIRLCFASISSHCRQIPS